MAVTVPRILAVDLSLRGTGLVCMPADFATSLDWARIAWRTVGHKLKRDARECDRIGRLVRLSGEIVDFAGEHGATVAVFEEYAFSRNGAGSRAIAELGGVTKVLLTTMVGLEVHTVPASSARKLLLGKVPRTDQKDTVVAQLARMGVPFADEPDACDAFVAGNWLAAELGFVAVALREAA